MIKKEINDVVKDLKEIFNIKEKEFELDNPMCIHTSKDGEECFMINKQYKERYEVISLLQDYFLDKVVKDGYCEVDNITFVFTTFKIKKGKPE